MSLFTEWEVVNLTHKVDAYSEMLSKAAQQYAALEEQRDELLEALKDMVALYNTDEGCRSLPEHQAACAAIARAEGAV